MPLYIDYWDYWYLHRVFGEYPFKVFRDADCEKCIVLEFRYFEFSYSKLEYRIELEVSNKSFVHTTPKIEENRMLFLDEETYTRFFNLLMGTKYDFSAIMTSSGVMLKVQFTKNITYQISLTVQ
jgi:hypothetical protein